MRPTSSPQQVESNRRQSGAERRPRNPLGVPQPGRERPPPSAATRLVQAAAPGVAHAPAAGVHVGANVRVIVCDESRELTLTKTTTMSVPCTRPSTVSCRPSRTGSWRCARRGQCLGARRRPRSLHDAASGIDRACAQRRNTRDDIAGADTIARWVQASLNQKQRLRQLFLHEGISFDGNRFNRTAATAPFFKYLAAGESADERVVSREGIEPSTRRLRVCCSAN